jgi:hypothetical protein
MLLLDLPVGSAAELAFVRALAATAPDMLVTVPAADVPTIRRIRDGLRLQIEDLDETPSTDGRAAAAGTGGLRTFALPL